MKRAYQRRDTERGNLRGVLPDPILPKESVPEVTDEIKVGEELKTEIIDPEELAKVPKSNREKFRFLLSYVNELLGVIGRLEDKLQQNSNAAIVGKTMVAGLVHDLRNPVAVINSCAQFCLENEKLTPVTQEYLQMVQENSKKVATMLNHFLEFSKVRLSFKSVNLNQIIQKTWRSAIGLHRAAFESDLAEDLPEIFGDPEKIERIFLNLFLNAIQAVSQDSLPGMVTVQTRLLQKENMAEVTIIDNGPGIPEEIQDRLFKPFFTTRKGGTGLGLHLCQYFVEQHKGKINLERAPKGGTKVTVRLPITQG